MRKTLIGFLHNFKIFGDGLAKRRGLPGEKLFCEAKLQVARSFATQPRNENYSCARSPMKCIALVLAIVMVGITAAACTMYEGYGGGEAPVVDTCGHDVTVYETAVLGEVVLASLREAPQFSTVTGSSIEFDGASVTKVISIHEKNYADVTISLDANPGILGFLADLLFDDTVLTPVSIMVEAGLMDFKITTSPLEGGRYSGRLIFLADSAVRTYETGAIATVRFSASEINHDLPIELGYLDVVPGDFFGELMGFAPFESGNALARSAAQGMTPPVVLVTPFTPEGIALGDADNDGWLTDLDVDAIRWHIAGSSEIINRRAADFDLDGTIDGIDVLLLRAALAGHPVPIGSPPQSLTIIPYCTTGMPVYNAEIEVFVNNVRTVHQTQTGIISIRNIPNGSRVRFNVTSASGHFFSQEITHFNYDIHGVQAVTLGGNALEVAGTRVSKSVVTVPGGNYIDVTLSLDANPGIYSFLTDLVFDTTRLTPVSITLRDDLFLQNVGITQPPLDGGRYPNRRIFVALVGGGTTSTATGLISTTRFRVNGGVNQPLPIVIGRLELMTPDGSVGMAGFSVYASNEMLGGYGIDTSTPELSPFLIPTKESFLPCGATILSISEFLPGDADGDGSVTLLDLTTILLYVAGHNISINRRNADVNADGVINLEDATLLARFLIGHNVTLGSDPNSTTILPISGGLPVYNARLEWFRDGVRQADHTTTTGVLSIAVPRENGVAGMVAYNVVADGFGRIPAQQELQVTGRMQPRSVELIRINTSLWSNPKPDANQVTSPFGWRVRDGNLEFHTGVDLVVRATGASRPVVSPTAGSVVFSEYDYDGGGGYMVQIETTGAGERFFITFAHLATPSTLQVGDTVSAGTPIGMSGSTGNTSGSGSHLHFGITTRAYPIWPRDWVDPFRFIPIP